MPMRQSACLIFNPINVDNYAAVFNCTPVGHDDPDLKLFILVGWVSCLLLGPTGFNSTGVFSVAPDFQ